MSQKNDYIKLFVDTDSTEGFDEAAEDLRSAATNLASLLSAATCAEEGDLNITMSSISSLTYNISSLLTFAEAMDSVYFLRKYDKQINQSAEQS
ncbi:MAG: hypothetical protein AB2809_06950 [Candidatus Thiodiazotropha sp.]